MTNPVLFGNALALAADLLDHTPPGGKDAPGPCASSRALALSHIAMADVCSLLGAGYEPWIGHPQPPGGGKLSRNAAIAAAAYAVVVAIYKSKAAVHGHAYRQYILSLGKEPGIEAGEALGFQVAAAVLKERAGDPPASSLSRPTYDKPAGNSTEIHDIDPLHPRLQFYGEVWATIGKPFGMESVDQVTVRDFASIPPEERQKDLAEVRDFGSYMSADRTQTQTDIGISWSYDGSAGIGTPPRLYNQFLVAVARHDGRVGDIDDLARLLALANIAMADAAIVAWRGKYRHKVARPVRWINGPNLDPDGEPIPGRALWEPLGAQASRGAAAQAQAGSQAAPEAAPASVFGSLAAPAASQRADFTPPFPAYPSGHASIGTAALSVLRLWRTPQDKGQEGNDTLDLLFQSDEFNGLTEDSRGKTRPAKTMRFRSISQAIEENNESRIWLGVHWRFDATYGSQAGQEIARIVLDRRYRPREQHLSGAWG